MQVRSGRPPGRPGGVGESRTETVMNIDARQIEVVNPEMVDVLRKMTGAERLAVANRMFVFARDLLISHLGAQHPDWDDTRIKTETARRLPHGAV